MVKEGTKLTAQTKVDNDLMAAITGEDGFMRAGALPSLPTATKGGAKKLLDAVTQAFRGSRISLFMFPLVLGSLWSHKVSNLFQTQFIQSFR